jgi:hypothetical protein
MEVFGKYIEERSVYRATTDLRISHRILSEICEDEYASEDRTAAACRQVGRDEDSLRRLLREVGLELVESELRDGKLMLIIEAKEE